MKQLIQSPRFLLLLAASIFLFAGLSGYDLSAPDEPRFAQVAREMMQTHDFLQPHRNDRPYPDKPPLFFWSIALLSYLLGGEVTELTARLPSMLSALAIIGLMFGWVERSGRSSPVVACLVLMTTYRFFFQAHQAQIDMLLCLCTTWALIQGFDALEGRPYRPWLLGLALGLGILAKGPVGYLVPVGTLALYASISGREYWRRFPGKALLWGLLPPLLWIAGLLVQVVVQDQWAYFKNLMIDQTFVRAFNPWHHHKPIYYYFTTLLHHFMPWWPILLGALPLGREKWRSLSPQQRFAWSAIIFTLIFFSLSKGKRALYILPLYPFAAYLTAAAIEHAIQHVIKFGSLDLLRRTLWSFPGLVLAIAGSALVAVGGGWIRPDEIHRFGSSPPLTAMFSTGLLVGSAGLAQFSNVVRNRLRSTLPLLASAMIVLGLFFYLIAMPLISPSRSARVFSERATEIIRSQSPDLRQQVVVGMVDFRSAYRFYGHYPLVELTPLNPLKSERKLVGLPTLMDFWTSHPQAWVFIREEHLQAYLQAYPGQIRYRNWYQHTSGEGDTFILAQGSMAMGR